MLKKGLVIGKLIEAILRDRISLDVSRNQNIFQRGFTKNSSPLNAAFIIEELYRESKDSKTELNLILLDAKSAFDVVDHQHLLRRLYHMGVSDLHWNILESFHKDSVSSIKWRGRISSEFHVQQGVRQGGVLSTDLYKIYVNPLLNRLQDANIGSTIGGVRCSARACADDICLCAEAASDSQELLNIAVEFANMERYLLQPAKSVHIRIHHQRRTKHQQSLFMNDSKLSSVKKSLHLGIIRTDSVLNNQRENVEENVKKARRKAYSLFGSGYKGQTGLDVSTVVYLYKTYIVPVLLYGMEILLPPVNLVHKLETFQRKLVKEILRLPDNTANPAIQVITGLPVEAQIHLRALTFLHTIASQEDSSAEKQIMYRQLQVKSVESSSWFIAIQHILWRYDLGTIQQLIEYLPTKQQWKGQIHGAVNKYWISSRCILHLIFLRMTLLYRGELFHW
ncbi:uncharacterized protein LOC128559140 [Mercenaria mercenaria]|uniref:uncharacterized protein LOC128559140 n=1 Tax=Mercenaria mercenaria TaxID=6596 RepID=UPI00234E60B1|nr:uncharacterized protein LOC128559140 [Mercenaria mercenaria]